MFWKLTFRQPSAIDTLLNEEECSLHDILDEDNVLQELKSQNKKLVDFFVRPEILEQLVKLVTLEPEENAEDKVKFKYPHLSCELLTCEVEAMVNTLSESEYLMGLLWAFLDQHEPLNPLLGSFISKVLGMLLCQKSTVIFNYIRDKEGFILAFLNHLGTSAIMDLLLQMVAAPDSDQCRVDLAWWFKEQGVVDRLIDFIHPTVDSMQCANASQTLCDMIRVSREAAQMAGPTPLLTTLESDVTMKRLLENMFCSDAPSDVVIVSGVSVLLTAIERRQSNTLSPSMNPSFMAEEISSNVQAIKEILGVIIPRMKDFHNLLVSPPNVPPMLTSTGRLDPPLGNTRLHVVRLFCALLQCNDPRVNREIASLKTFSTLMDLFFKFPWNNFLHTQVEGCVSAAVSCAAAAASDNTTDTSEDTQEAFSLKHHVLHDCQLVQRLLDGDEENQRLSSEPRGQRLGYMGHLIRMVNLILQCGEADQNLAQILKDAIEGDVQKKWNDFIAGTVADTNKKNETNLGGTRPMTSSMDDSDDEFDQLAPPDNELDKAYQHYQEVKYINTMVDEFGVDDNLRSNEEPYSGTFSHLMNISCTVVADEEQSQSAALFEAACSEKIQQFDDSESDEEESSTWADRDVTFTSPLDRQSSMSSDEEDSSNRQREFQTSFEEDSSKPSQRAALYVTTSPNTLSQITAKAGDDSDKMDVSSPYNTSTGWQTDLNQEDLSGVSPMDTAVGLGNWTKEPQAATTPPSPRSNWADFSSFNTQTGAHNQESRLDNSVDQRKDSQKEGNEIDVLSPPRHDTTQYSVISGTPSKEDVEGEAGSVDIENVELTVMDDISSPESPLSGTPHSGKGDSSSEEDSSGSDEERSGKYALNTSSEGEPLLQSPILSPPQQSAPSTNHEKRDSGQFSDVGSPKSGLERHPLPSNGVGVNATPAAVVKEKAAEPTAVSTESKKAENKVDEATSTAQSNSHDHLPDDKAEAVGEAADLSKNFDFLAKQGLLRDGSAASQELTNEQRVEKKRLEAMEMCKQYDQEVQGAQGVDAS